MCACNTRDCITPLLLVSLRAAPLPRELKAFMQPAWLHGGTQATALYQVWARYDLCAELTKSVLGCREAENYDKFGNLRIPEYEDQLGMYRKALDASSLVGQLSAAVRIPA